MFPRVDEQSCIKSAGGFVTSVRSLLFGRKTHQAEINVNLARARYVS